jgi:Phosphoribosylglycinamide synthetase, ATP-grasp (A) domain
VCLIDYFLISASYPALVVKASGLAAGKGVVVAGDANEACKAVDELSKLPAGSKLVVEELLEGEEVSVHSLNCNVVQELRFSFFSRFWPFVMEYGQSVCYQHRITSSCWMGTKDQILEEWEHIVHLTCYQKKNLPLSVRASFSQ